MQNIEEIYNKYARIVYKYIFCMTKDEDLAEEIVQDTFLTAVEKIDSFKGESKISTWLCQIAKYKWYERLKKHKKELPLEDLEKNQSLENILEEDLLNKENRKELFKKLQKLDEQTRNVMYLRILGDFNYDEIADIMGKTPNWARVTFFRGKQKIKEEDK